MGRRCGGDGGDGTIHIHAVGGTRGNGFVTEAGLNGQKRSGSMAHEAEQAKLAQARPCVEHQAAPTAVGALGGAGERVLAQRDVACCAASPLEARTVVRRQLGNVRRREAEIEAEW